MPPWLVWMPLLAAINLFLFIAARGRWGRIVLPLAIASLVGVATGDWLASVTGLEVVRIGDMHVVAASVVAQLLMVVVTLLAAFGPVRVQD
ncbi:hypothetical protein BH20CHL8_BH20CHL8_10880 [soil metagenome]